MVSIICCSREPLLNESSRQKTLEKAIKAVKDEVVPPYHISVRMDASGTRAIVTLSQGNLLLLWFACVFGAIFSGCVVMYCFPDYRWRISLDTRSDNQVDVVFGVPANKLRSCAECVLTPICCSGKVKKEYQTIHEAIRGALQRSGVRTTDESPETFEEIISSEGISDRKFLKCGISSTVLERRSHRV